MERTIAAISTAQAPGGIGIVRISGEGAIELAEELFSGSRKLKELEGYQAAFGRAVEADGRVIDEVIALVFKGPKSYTGEDVVELSCHGGIYVTRRLLARAIEAGARPAEPGEFTKRAFLNGRLDLTQAEAVMGLISASGDQAAREAAAGVDGVLSRRIEEIKSGLRDIAAHLAAWADFPEEDVPQVEIPRLKSQLREIEAGLKELSESYDRGRAVREGITTVISGKTNAGKSTLMNLISGSQRSIVTQIPGTTRDVVEETVMLSGIALRLADTAGIREAEDQVEQIGIERSFQRLKTAELVLAVFDSSRPLDKDDRSMLAEINTERAIAVINKTDLPQALDTAEIASRFKHCISISAKSGEGMAELERAVSDIMGSKSFDPSAGSLYTQRQKGDVDSAAAAISEAIFAAETGMTLDAITVSAEAALSDLCRLTGEVISEEIVDQVFSTFCVGK